MTPDDGGGSDGNAEDNHPPAPFVPALSVVQGATSRTPVRHGDPDEGDTHVFSIVHPTTMGELALSPDGLLAYEAPLDWAGDETAELMVIDQHGAGTAVVVSITVVERQAEASGGCSHTRAGRLGGLAGLVLLGLGTVRRRAPGAHPK